MIIYDTKNWSTTLLKIYLSFNKAYTTRVLFKYIFYLMIYTTVVVVIDLEILEGERHFKIDPLFFSTLGFILSLMLVFRLNTSYNKWWEGRQAWGTLINQSRSLSSHLNAIIPKDDWVSRKYFATQISNFAYSMQGHLRESMEWEGLERLDDEYLNRLQSAKHVPHKIATMLYERIEENIKEGRFTQADKITLFPQIEVLLNVLGICERIKNTPIPFAHNSYIKTFILVYLLTLPFAIMNTLMYYAIPTVALVAYALMGVEVVSEEVEDPFGREANDLPLIHLSNIIKNSVFEALEVDYEIKISSIEMDTKYIQIIY
jgi:ion channel-forming bestrophin family protein